MPSDTADTYTWDIDQAAQATDVRTGVLDIKRTSA